MLDTGTTSDRSGIRLAGPIVMLAWLSGLIVHVVRVAALLVLFTMLEEDVGEDGEEDEEACAGSVCSITEPMRVTKDGREVYD